MLETTPFHRENYSRLIIGVIVQYYQQCSTQYKDLVTTTNSTMALPATWAQRDDVMSCLEEVKAAKTADAPAALSKEIKLVVDLLGPAPVIEAQLVASSRKLLQLCTLAQSLVSFLNSGRADPLALVHRFTTRSPSG